MLIILYDTAQKYKITNVEKHILSHILAIDYIIFMVALIIYIVLAIFLGKKYVK